MVMLLDVECIINAIEIAIPRQQGPSDYINLLCPGMGGLVGMNLPITLISIIWLQKSKKF